MMWSWGRLEIKEVKYKESRSWDGGSPGLDASQWAPALTCTWLGRGAASHAGGPAALPRVLPPRPPQSSPSPAHPHHCHPALVGARVARRWRPILPSSAGECRRRRGLPLWRVPIGEGRGGGRRQGKQIWRKQVFFRRWGWYRGATIRWLLLLLRVVHTGLGEAASCLRPLWQVIACLALPFGS